MGLVLILVGVYGIFEWVIELVLGCVILGRGARLAKLEKMWLRYTCSARGSVVLC